MTRRANGVRVLIVLLLNDRRLGGERLACCLQADSIAQVWLDANDPTEKTATSERWGWASFYLKLVGGRAGTKLRVEA